MGNTKPLLFLCVIAVLSSVDLLDARQPGVNQREDAHRVS